MKAVSFYLFQLILAPVTLAGLALLVFNAPGMRQRTGLSWPALASLAQRWLLHEFDDREDRSAARLVHALPEMLDRALRLAAFATITGAHLTGYRPAVLRYEMGERPAGVNRLSARLAFIDDMLAEHVPEVRQVVILDAGFGTHACEELAGRALTVFEVVPPAVAGPRRTLYQKAGVTPDAQLVQLDLATADAAHALLPALVDAGFDASAATLFLIEAQLSYLEQPRVSALLRALASLPATTLLMFDYVASDYTDPATSAIRPSGVLARWLAEPLRFGLPTFAPAQLPAERFLGTCGGWQIVHFETVGPERAGFHRAHAGLVLARTAAGRPAAAALTEAPAAVADPPEPDQADQPPAAASPAAAALANAAAAPLRTDDLKRIKGIGPKLETLLNENGISRLEQVADLDAAAISALDDKLRFRGRITRDNWVGQARALLDERGTS